ncbi:SNF1-related protein kinase regulatory subunit beta-1 [Ananas comosus]|uniref:SNF1-related protein kinase regulatory subunit beta-1 n=1 Tax=Ananas comosus TaxID=4615 RepID=A0A199VHK8_ANACO|nr:SNF1-related protein kinase regulatory subunit beta-1 [Ananas comosus]
MGLKLLRGFGTVPVPPLQRHSDSPQLSNQVSTNEQHGSSKDPPERKIPVLLVWTLGGKKVHVEGSWDNWTEKLSLQRSGKDHSILMSLPSGIYRYRFIVDGERRFIPDFPCITDETGNTASRIRHPPSPDSATVGRSLRSGLCEGAAALPPQLHFTVLDLENSEAAATVKPHHVLLNHLFIEKPGVPSHSSVSASLTGFNPNTSQSSCTSPWNDNIARPHSISHI